MQCGQNPLGGRWHHHSCTCIKSFVPVGLVNSRWLRLEYTRVEIARRFFVFTQRALHVCTLGVTNGNWRGLPARNFLCMCKNGGVTSHPKDFFRTASVLEKTNKVRYFLISLKRWNKNKQNDCTSLGKNAEISEQGHLEPWNLVTWSRIVQTKATRRQTAELGPVIELLNPSGIFWNDPRIYIFISSIFCGQ